MKIEDEIKSARDIVPFARASFIIREIEEEATEEELKNLFELVVWAYAFDREFDWVWHMKDCPLLVGVTSYQEATEQVERWFGHNEFPLNEKRHDDLNVFEHWIVPVLDDWLEGKLDDYLGSATWKGVKGLHAVHWDHEKKGHVVIFIGDDAEPTFDYQL